MARKLNDAHIALLDKQSFAHLATLMPDGSPQTSPVWVDHRDGNVIVNSARGRLKDRNIERDGRVALSITDPDNPYQSLTIRGVVTEVTTEGADAHINAMAKKYMGVDEYPYRAPGEVRVVYVIKPSRVSSMP